VPTRVLKRGSREIGIDPGLVRRIGDRMLEALGLERAELSVLLTDDAQIRELNREHLGKDRATDVLAFPLDALDGAAPIGDRLLGDVVISLETAGKQAASRKRELAGEVRFLLAHGLLHLVGYDHASSEQKREMSAATRRLVRAARSLPNVSPSQRPSARPSQPPSARPSQGPSRRPSRRPGQRPSERPSQRPSRRPRSR
jgi:probable rRNA maturation factor